MNFLIFIITNPADIGSRVVTGAPVDADVDDTGAIESDSRGTHTHQCWLFQGHINRWQSAGILVCDRRNMNRSAVVDRSPCRTNTSIDMNPVAKIDHRAGNPQGPDSSGIGRITAIANRGIR